MLVLSDYRNIPVLLNIDINCDMGEGMDNEALIMPFISSANIACGFHAGDENIMKQTMQLAISHGVSIGAHPSFFDRTNFGRTEMDLSPGQIYDLMILQLRTIDNTARSLQTKLRHVKPHGALYNLSAKNESVAFAIARAVYEFDDGLLLFGLSGSASVSQSTRLGLKTLNEVFADRTYRDDGSLTPRSEPNALIKNLDEAITQAVQMARDHSVTTTSGKTIQVQADTICIHGDGEHAVALARAIHEALRKENIVITANLS